MWYLLREVPVRHGDSTKIVCVSDINARDRLRPTALHFSVQTGTGYSDISSLLLKHGVDVNVKDSEGQTAMHIACRDFSYTCRERSIGRSL